MIKAFPKIFHIGTKFIKDIFLDEVEITEKIDGSQFDFGILDNELYMRSKGKELLVDAPEKMFKVAIDYVVSIKDKLPKDTIFYCEYLQSSDHNCVKYDRIPKNNLILFGVCDKSLDFISDYKKLKEYADEIDIETVPLIFSGKIKHQEEITELLETDSILGNSKVEGIVAKNYARDMMVGGQAFTIMAGKYVSEKFKEVNNENFKKKFTGRGRFETFKDSFKTDARWLKAIQHLKESGELDNSPKDIGKLIVEIKKDIEEEEKENIKDFLWKEFSNEVLRNSVGGFPEWYKKQLLGNSFKEE